jgi:hypothetical protein
MNRSALLTATAVCFFAAASQSGWAAQENIPPAQLMSFQSRADQLAISISAVIRTAEESTKNLPSAEREAAIQSAVQGAIIASGDDPRIVLAVLQAFGLCPTAQGRYSVTQVPVSCAGLKTPASSEARQALASLQTVVLALIDQNEAPGSLGIGGVAPYTNDPGAAPGGGWRGPANTGGSTITSNGGGGSSSNDPPPGGGGSNSASINSDPGPGGGGSSGYNTN